MRSSLDFQAPSQLFAFIIWSVLWTCIGVGILMLMNSSSSSSFSSYLWKSLHQKRPRTTNISSQKSIFWILCFRFWITTILLHEIITKPFKSPWLSSQLKTTDHWRFKAFFFFLFIFFGESVRSVSYASHNSAISLPSSYPPGNSVRGKSAQTRQLPSIEFGSRISATRRCCTDARWVFCLQKTRKQKTLKQHLTQGPRPTRARAENLPDT
jgi:hypothetical protein